MPESVEGLVHITVTGSSEDVTISLDGDTGDVQLGGAGRDGDLHVQDGSGQDRIHLNGSVNSITIRNAAGDAIATLGPNGNLDLGGVGSDGDITIRDNQDTIRMRLDGDAQRLRIYDATGTRVVELGPNGNLILGGGESDGDISLRDAGGVTRLALDAQNHRLLIRDASGHEIGRLGDFANLKLGSGGHDGDILLYPGSAPNMDANEDATIHLDANAGDIILRNADFAEDFDIAPSASAEPGTVMALAGDGEGLRPSQVAHDRTVVGVVSSAGDYRPGIVLDRQPDRDGRRPIAMVGKVYVRVTDEAGPIGIGDLLTSSSTPGVAMRAADPAQAFGAVIGKALARHDHGDGMIPMVSALQ